MLVVWLVGGTGTDVTVVTFSRPVGLALEAAAKLEKEGISVEVRFLS